MKTRQSSKIIPRQLPDIIAIEQPQAGGNNGNEDSVDASLSIGETMAGLVHELNNPLTGVIGFAQLAARSQDCPDTIRHNLDLVVSQAARCRKVLEDALNASRSQPAEKKGLHVNDLLNSAVELMGTEFKLDKVALECMTSPKDTVINADEQQMLQVIINLLNNARHAVRLKKGKGRVRLSESVRSGKVRIQVTDNGEGISKENLPRIFERYFTTKPDSEGTGLGLPICKEIVERHGGSISVETSPSVGTAVTVDLPAAARDGSEAVLERLAQQSDLTGKRVLLIESDPLTVMVLRDYLRGAKCFTFTSASVMSTLDALRYHRIDLLLLNPITLGGSVADLMATIAQEYTGVRTGLLVHTDARSGFELPRTQLPRLAVPFSRNRFQSFIKEILLGCNQPQQA